MQHSTERILTTHTGSLPRPAGLQRLLFARESGEPIDVEAFEEQVRAAVNETVRKQEEVGIDVVNDGEMSKISFATYVKDRLTGFRPVGSMQRRVPADLKDFPGYAPRRVQAPSSQVPTSWACTGPITYVGHEAVQQDIAHLRTALQGSRASEAFLTAASPGVIALQLENRFYPSHEAYLAALADAMKQEYDAIGESGFLLQLDCPDLAGGRHTLFADVELSDFRRQAALHVEALNHAVRDIPADRLRLHLCWGNYEGPHHKDVPLGDIIDIALRAKPAALSFEASNPRHEHEWAVFETVKLPAEKVLIPGMLDSTTNFIEHPEVVAQRLMRFASVVGREQVMAGTDCGFASFAGMDMVEPHIAWAKLQALAEGARLASQRLW